MFVGTFFHGNQPHPANLPPGVWYIRKLSPSPTLVTFPNTVRRRSHEGEMLGASGNRRRKRRWNRMATRMPLVKTRDEISVRGSVKAFQSRMALLLSEGCVGSDFCNELKKLLSCELLSVFDSELHGDHRMTTLPLRWQGLKGWREEEPRRCCCVGFGPAKLTSTDLPSAAWS